jgi:lipopolysaccharide biosynthesis protein
MNDFLRNALFRGLRRAFRLVPLREDARDRIRQRFFDSFPQVMPSGPRGIEPMAGASRRARVHAGPRALGYVERVAEPLPSPLPATLVAFYLPQFHPIPENDTWWGRGFTEWTNVTRALPQFEGHAQPRLPEGLGYYDLRNPQVMREQAQLAREYGIGAFCFYFYWFGGKTLLETPLEQWLQDRSMALPFCLCWANENWSRAWDGRAGDVLIGQSHSPEDDIAFIAHCARYLRDPRYLRIDGKPLLLVYRPGLLPDPKATTERWRSWCRDNGIGEIFVAYVQGFERPDPRDIGFDAAVEFPPNLSTPPNITARQRLINPAYEGEVVDWRALADDYRKRTLPPYRLFPGVNCGWDNEPRRAGKGRTYLHASPHAYEDWLHDTVAHRLSQVSPPERFVFLNAWNEWAEGAVLEPDARLGHAWLDATRRALQRASGHHVRRSSSPVAVVHAWYPETFEGIIDALQASGVSFRLIVTTTPEQAMAVRAILETRQLEAELVVGENRGRDVLPFLRVAYRLRAEGEDIVLKLHTKRSPHHGHGDRWRDELLDRLVSPRRAAAILAALERDKGLGVVAPEEHLLPLASYQGANRSSLAHAVTRMGIGEPPPASDFVSGSMFWTRLDALHPLLDAHFDEWEFEPESGQIDGTFAHAIERAFALSAHACGLRVVTAASACGEPEPATRAEYPYASRT